MGKNYVIRTLGYSWDRIMCFHCTYKMPKTMLQHVALYGERITPQKDIPVNYKIIGYESHSHYLWSHQRGTLLLLHI